MRYRFAVALAVALVALFTDIVLRDTQRQVAQLAACRAWHLESIERIEEGGEAAARPNELCA